MFEKIYTQFDGRDAIIVKGLGEYDLGATMECGQCFRYERVSRDDMTEYITVVGGEIIDVGQVKRGELIFFCMSDEVFSSVAVPYFALTTDLDEVRRDILGRTDSEWLRSAAACAGGVAILAQQPWEALISFIISQNNNIPRIRRIIREVCAEYGVNICLQKGIKKCPAKLTDATPCEEICKKCGRCYTFPTAEEIAMAPEGLLPSKPGFRYKYILDAANRVVSGKTDLEAIKRLGSYQASVEELTKILGVGNKVASCVALFAMENLDAFPVDVWMKRAIDTYFDGALDPATLGPYAGYAQQYIFHYIRNIENSENK
ncbi:MAG: DNA-3-methyladenine glycosylase 2 [Clostridia bacterium]|nr:DNA-3-methyladenine glycosylase 2 [Clostridia bacterium]